MTARRLHITGASGTGTSTLGRAMADAWSVPFHDSDDYFWLPTEPPYARARDRADRLALMAQMFLPRRAWVLSGSLMNWAETVVPRLDLVVFLRLDPQVRLQRLRLREARRYGADAIAPGGAYHAGFAEFMAWAALYDGADPAFAGRSLARHRDWLATLPCKVIELDASVPVPDLVAAVARACADDRLNPTANRNAV